MSASRVSWATFWARSMISFASRRATAIASARSAADDFALVTGRFGVCEALGDLRPPIVQHLCDRLGEEHLEQREEQDEVRRGDDDPEQVDRQTTGRRFLGRETDGRPRRRPDER